MRSRSFRVRGVTTMWDSLAIVPTYGRAARCHVDDVEGMLVRSVINPCVLVVRVREIVVASPQTSESCEHAKRDDSRPKRRRMVSR